jgi:phage terminase small subunit
MPREPKSALTLVHSGIGPRRLEPPPELGGIEAEVFRTTIAAVGFDHFQPEDVPMLAAYCRAVAMERRASEELATCATVGDQPSPWLEVEEKAWRKMAGLATKLRIGPRSRRPNDSRRAAKSGRPPSYYEIMAQERERAASKAPRS